MTFKKIFNTSKNYAWGSETLIPEFLGKTPDGENHAEVWFGTHNAGSALYVDSSTPVSEDYDLPFMVKLLAAGKPLSIQVHPSKSEAVLGFEKENSAGVSLDNESRNYKDDNHKPEMIIAINDGFKALIGFRDSVETVQVLKVLVSESVDKLVCVEKLINIFESTVEVSFVSLMKEMFDTSFGKSLSEELTEVLRNFETDVEEINILKFVAKNFPNDIGLSVAVLMNAVVFKTGDAVFVPDGVLHAYVEGFGIEVMANSDNVLRGGLTPKHVDSEEMIKLVSDKVLYDPVLKPVSKNNSLMYKPVHDFFVVDCYSGSVDLEGQDVIAVALEHSVIYHGQEYTVLDKGDALIISNESMCDVSGHVVFVM